MRSGKGKRKELLHRDVVVEYTAKARVNSQSVYSNLMKS